MLNSYEKNNKIVRKNFLTSFLKITIIVTNTGAWCKLERKVAMKCPFCGKENTRVIDSRPAEENNSIRRRRLCDGCEKRFTTYEKIETIPLVIIKKDNNREPYDRSKLESGIIRSCHKRPVSMDEIMALVDEVETIIFNMEEKEIPSSKIGEILMDRLKELDQVAYVRFASVYREFKDAKTFMDELEKLNGEGAAHV